MKTITRKSLLYKTEVDEQHQKLFPLDDFENKRCQILAVCPPELIDWLKDLLCFLIQREKTE